MKKVLFATTALVASAGFAAAQGVELSGSAEMGIIGGSSDIGDIETQFHTDIDVTFTMSGETDNGLSFGASIDLDESDGDPSGAFGATTQGGESIFVSGDWGTLTMGDTDGALDWALSEAIIGSAINDDHEHAGYNGNAALDGTYDGQVARYDYSFGDFAVALSAEVDDTGAGDAVLGLGAKYSADLGGVALDVGLGFQSNDVIDAFGISVKAAMDNGVTAIINYSDYDTLGDHTGLALGYSMDALTVAANYGVFDTPVGDIDGYGLVVNYDLGGGAELQAGYGSSDILGVGVDTFSFGVAMSF